MQLENDFKALKEKSANAENQAGSSSCSDTSVASSASRGVDNVAAISENIVAAKKSVVSVTSQDASATSIKQELANGEADKAARIEEEICAERSETQKTVFVIAEGDLQVNAIYTRNRLNTCTCTLFLITYRVSDYSQGFLGEIGDVKYRNFETCLSALNELI